MLVLKRKVGERVMLSGGIVITLVDIDGKFARLGFEAPPECEIFREEILTGAKQAPTRKPERTARERLSEAVTALRESPAK